MARKVDVISHIEANIVVIDRIRNKPFIAVAVFLAANATEVPVSYGSQALRYGNAYGQAIGFVGKVILVWPPKAGANTLAGYGHPWISGIIL